MTAKNKSEPFNWIMFIIVALLTSIIFFFFYNNVPKFQFTIDNVISRYKENSKVIYDLLTTISAIIVAIVAIAGLSTWRTQLKGNSEYDLAKKIILNIFLLRSKIYKLRMYFLNNKRIMIFLEKTGDFEKDLNQFIDAQANYQSYILEGEVLWGKKFRNIAQGFDGFLDTFLEAVLYFHMNESKKKRIKGKRESKIKYAFLSGEYQEKEIDIFNNELNNSIRSIEDFLTPYLSL